MSNDQRAGLATAATNQSLRLTGGIVIEGDGINQINNGSTVAGNQLQINGGITGTSNGTLFLRGTGEIQVNSVINTPNVILAKTDAGLLIMNASGHDYREAQLVHGTVRTDVVNALDTGAIVRMGQGGNGQYLGSERQQPDGGRHPDQCGGDRQLRPHHHLGGSSHPQCEYGSGHGR